MNRARFFQTPARLEEGAFEALFSEYYARVYGILFRLTGDRYQADDLAAETFWRLWERPPARDENMAGWLYRVATRLGYNALRAERRREQYEAEAGQASWSSEPEADPAQQAEQNQERARVRQVLRQMALKDVQVLVLRHSGLSYKDIGAALGQPTGSVGTLLARAEQKFEALYQRGEGHAPK